MLKGIIDISLRNKAVVLLMVLGLIGFGIYSFTQLPIDAVPDITNNQVQVITVAPQFAAEEVERNITFPIEQNLTGIPEVIEMRSFSRFGLSLITIVFKDDKDVYWARQQVSERLQLVRDELPKDVASPYLAPITTGLGEIFQYSVVPKKGFEALYSPIELRTIQDWIIRRQLLGTPGVADVSSFGGKVKQISVEIDPDKMASLGVTLSELMSAIEQNNKNIGGAYIERNDNILFIKTDGLYLEKKDIENTIVKRSVNKLPILVKDVSTVSNAFALPYGALTVNGEKEVAGGIVMMLKGENSSKVIKEVKKRIEAISKTLPKGVELVPFLDRTKMVDNAIHTVRNNLLEAAVIVLLILMLFLGNIRAGLIVASVIPLSLLFAVILMNLTGVSGNLMSLGALDFGLMVDGAVIVVEAVLFRLYQLYHTEKISVLSREELSHEVGNTSAQLMQSAVFGQVIILIVYIPLLTLGGIEGKMFIPMAKTVAFALLGAFILSLTYIPVVTAIVMGRDLTKQTNFSHTMMEKLERGYQKLLTVFINHTKKIVFLGVIPLLILSFILFSRMGGEFIPTLEEGDFAVETRLVNGSSLTHSIEKINQAASLLKNTYPEIEQVVAKIGSGEIPTDPMPVEAADMMIMLKPKKEWKSAKTFDELSEKMLETLKPITGLFFSFQYPVQMRFNELMTGAKQDVVCKIYGEDLDSLTHIAEQVGAIVSKTQGATQVFVEQITGSPQIRIKINREQLNRFNLTIDELNAWIEASFAGAKSGIFYEGEKRFDIVLRLSDANRNNLSYLKQLKIPLEGGLVTPLSNLADISIAYAPNQIQRDFAKRRIMVGFNIVDRDVESVVEEVKKKLSQKLKLPTGYSYDFGGQFENLQHAKERLMITVPIALLLIFVLLFFSFQSFRTALLIYIAIPLSAIGGIFALYIRDMPFSISAGVGFIALFGVSVLNGIVLVAQFKKIEGKRDIGSIIHAASTRLRPVLMTATVASLGFLPMAMSNGAGAEVQRPLATVVIGGLITATLLTLFVLPSLYIQTHKKEINES